ncbi:peptidylprolyl isomerase [Bordetella genomosp. 13]|uniref:peptidylprolyl isomerase n=1 Tax=Bordetella genomosp. 13 TaxID=463040 RepID=UPI00119DCF42|nr:peptidylprolyl isomerase [Bordetella genomosp. 13]
MKNSDHVALRMRWMSAFGLALVLCGCGDKGNAEQAQKPAETASAAQAAKPAAAAAPASSSPAVATLGAVSVSQEHIEQLLRSLPPAQRQQLTANRAALEQVVRSSLAEKALLSQARAQNWADKPEIQRAIQAAQEQIVFRSYLDSVSQPPDSYPSEAELQQAYEQNKARFVQPAAYRLSQIFLAAPANDADAVAAARKKAADLIKRARAPQADFAQLAQESSQDKESAARGGDTGFIPLQQVVPELRNTVQRLKKGEVSEMVQLPAGLHIVKLVDLRETRQVPLTEVQVQLRDTMRAQRQQDAARAYLEGLLNAGTVSIDGKALQSAVDGAK